MSFFLFTVARLRLFVVAFLVLVNVVNAHEQTLFTSSVSYCAPAHTLLVQRFDVAYFASNSSVSFNISASSVEANVSVAANLLLNVYGMHPVNITIDLCGILNGALCPLPQYNFTGWDSIPLSTYVDVSGKIPGIAYQVPDLEGYVQLTLTEVGTGVVKSCVQATLSNGWSMRQTAVEWATGGLALFALALAVWSSLSPESLVPYRLLELIYLYQSIAVTGLLNLNYPLAYISFALNFAWSMGLFPSKTFQNTINNMRSRTGGDGDSSEGSTLALTNRKSSPYNAVASPSAAGFLKPQGFTVNREAFSTFAASANLSPVSSDLDVSAIHESARLATVTSSSGNVLEAGLPTYVNSLDIPLPNVFMTAFFVALIFMAITVGIMLLAVAVIYTCKRFGWIGHERAQLLQESIPTTLKAWGLRLALIIFTPIILFSFYQWTLKDSWASVLLSVISFLLVCACVGYSGFLALRWRQSDDSWPFHTPFWGQYRSSRHWFFVPLVAASICKSLFIAFAKANGKVQVILMIIVEFAVVASVLTFRPHLTRGGDVLSTYLAIVRLVCTGLLVAFLVEVGLAPIPRVVIGIIAAVIFSVAVVVMFINLMFHLIQSFRPRAPLQRLSSGRASSDLEEPSMLEKGKDSS